MALANSIRKANDEEALTLNNVPGSTQVGELKDATEVLQSTPISSQVRRPSLSVSMIPLTPQQRIGSQVGGNIGEILNSMDMLVQHMKSNLGMTNPEGLQRSTVSRQSFSGFEPQEVMFSGFEENVETAQQSPGNEANNITSGKTENAFNAFMEKITDLQKLCRNNQLEDTYLSSEGAAAAYSEATDTLAELPVIPTNLITIRTLRSRKVTRLGVEPPPDLAGTDQVTSFPCGRCGKVCGSRIGLYSHSKVCQSNIDVA